MRLSENIRLMLNEQFRHERRNELIYTQFRAWAEFKGFLGVAKLFENQANGEHDHGEMVFKYLMDKNDLINIEPFHYDEAAPAFTGSSIYELMQKTLEVEYGTTAALDAIYKAAHDEGDYQTVAFILPMIKEQTEEESLAQTIIDRFDQYPASPSRDHDMDCWIDKVFNQ